jgi:hypothetical protein
MPRINFATIDSVSDFAPLPDGEYTCVLADIETDITRAGDPMWKLRWTVEGGEHAGRILFDNLVFSAKAMPRVKLVCGSCGLEVTGEVDLEPTMLLGKHARITTFIEEFRDDQGAAKVRNRIPFGGYSAVSAADDDNCPF